MTIKQRIAKLEAQHSEAEPDEALAITLASGREVAILSPAGFGATWPRLFESIAANGGTINDFAREPR